MTRVAIGLSGGVDSAAAAALLKEEGYDVVGFTLKVWDSSRCCSIEDVNDAARVADALDIPFYVLDAHDIFKKEVVDPFVRSYAEGKTPNPCIPCNQKVKFSWLLERAAQLGCDYVATGHYARLEGEPGARKLLRGLDATKDQSYFLVPDNPDGLDRVLFPLGALRKSEVRKIAERYKLPVATKSDSQDVCFVHDGDLEGFLSAHLGENPGGEIVDTAGQVRGRHSGVFAYTVGQRKGLGISNPTPLYVIERDVENNRLVVGPREDTYSNGLLASAAVWLHGAPDVGEFDCTVKIRSTASGEPCKVAREGDNVQVTFASPQFGVAPGQMAVFYDGDLVLGGAWITGAVK
jgi:tRNA-specific 2-thiouridylase